jgi:hypothetical protein
MRSIQRYRADGRVILRTRRGKTHVMRADHPELRPATLWERLFKKRRFPQIEP